MYELTQAEIVQLRTDAGGLLERAEVVSNINSLEDEGKAVEFLSEVKRRSKAVDAKRKEYVAPLKEVIDNVNADFKTILEPLERAEVIVKKGMTVFRDAEDFRTKEALRIEAENKARQAVWVASNDMSTENLEKATEASWDLKDAKALAPKTVDTLSGQARFRRSWKFEITDPDLVPEGFRSPDPTKIKQSVGFGARNIPGVRIYEETTPIIMS